MKREIMLAGMFIVLVISSGCAGTKENTNSINQLKSQMVNIESLVSRQNLLIQQNKNEIETVLDRNDELAMEVARLRQQAAVTPKPITTTPISSQTPRITETSSQTALVSDKLQPQPSIRNIQMALRNAGFYIGNVDGKVGPLTRDAVKKFQEANDLTSDGVVGRKTWAKLKDYL